MRRERLWLLFTKRAHDAAGDGTPAADSANNARAAASARRPGARHRWRYWWLIGPVFAWLMDHVFDWWPWLARWWRGE